MRCYAPLYSYLRIALPCALFVVDISGPFAWLEDGLTGYDGYVLSKSVAESRRPMAYEMIVKSNVDSASAGRC